ncbi:MAG: class II fructose-bisphosphate aldolase [[Clostridium] scindens]
MYERVENILKMAEESNTSAIAFICMDDTMARSVVCAAEATNTPAIIMLYPEHVTIQKTCNLSGFAAMVEEMAKEAKVPIGLHADHDYTYDAIINTVNKGFRSVMMDGSMNDLDTNIALTKKVVDKAHELGAIVEGEIGHVGIAANADNNKEDLYTKADAAEKFCRETGVDSLAISIGNAHGEYKDTPNLDIARLEEIHAAVNVPLVLHGGSGIPDDQYSRLHFQKESESLIWEQNSWEDTDDAVAQFVKENAKNPDPVKIINLPEYAGARLVPYLEERMKTLCRF